MEIAARTGERDPGAEEIGVALTRRLVMRKTLVKPPGANTGIPKNVIELPLTRPWKALLPGVVALIPCRVSVATGIVLPGARETYSKQPCTGVVQRFSAAAGPKFGTGAGEPDPGSSISSRASEVLPVNAVQRQHTAGHGGIEK